MSTSPSELRGAALAWYVVDLIEDNLAHWNQAFFHCSDGRSCRTTHCFAGFCQLVLYDHEPDENEDWYWSLRRQRLIDDADTTASRALGITRDERDQLFYANYGNDFEALVTTVESIFGPRPTSTEGGAS